MKIMMILSGGLDSATALYELRREHEVVEALTFDYGQRHGDREISSARKICEIARVPHRLIDLRNLNELLQGSSLTTPAIATPHGHYHQENMKLTVVPNRNAIMINLAAGYAVSRKIYGLGLGVHTDDRHVYADCRPEFIESQQETLSLANECDFQLLTPFINFQKSEIVALGMSLGVPLEHTWSCYEGGEKPCEKCSTCLARAEAFQENGHADPAISK